VWRHNPISVTNLRLILRRQAGRRVCEDEFSAICADVSGGLIASGV
jgi:hypothetical protein